jgi:hypothetical protein
VKIYTVLKVGEFYNRKIRADYGPIHVQWMQRMCQKYAPGVEFVCLSNVDIDGVTVIPLEKNWPGWWSKIELFKYSDVFYLDLDTVIIDNIGDIIGLDGFYALDLFQPNNKFIKILGSGLMSWNIDLSHIYKNFSDAVIPQYNTRIKWGDQGYVYDQVGGYISFQQTFPGKIFSYKYSNIDQTNPGGKIICFHGKPRPWEVEHSWIPPLKKD